MNIENTDEYSVTIQNLEKLRFAFGIDMKEVDKHTGLGSNTYSRIIGRKQIIDLVQLISIGRTLYNLKAVQILNPNLRIPPIQKLPEHIQVIVKERKGKSPRVQEEKNVIQYCTLILHQYYKVGDEFTNSQIKSHVKEKQEEVFGKQSIAWNRSTLTPFVQDTNKSKSATTKKEKIYRLIKQIPKEMADSAFEIVGNDWLTDPNNN